MSEDRPPFVLQRAHGVAPGFDSKAPAEPVPALRRQPRSAPTPDAKDKADKAKIVPPHLLVLADLHDQKKLIDAAIAAIEALYK
jgi:hypothetical protein